MKYIASILALLLSLFDTPFALAAPVTFTAVLNGAAEAPSNSSPGVAFATVIFDPVLYTMKPSPTFFGLVSLTSGGLPSGTTVAHIDCCTAAPVAGNVGLATRTPTFNGFPLGVTFGTYKQDVDSTLASSFNPAFVTANGGTLWRDSRTLGSGRTTAWQLCIPGVGSCSVGFWPAQKGGFPAGLSRIEPD